jgi:hypothetical protein
MTSQDTYDVEVNTKGRLGMSSAKSLAGDVVAVKENQIAFSAMPAGITGAGHEAKAQT